MVVLSPNVCKNVWPDREVCKISIVVDVSLNLRDQMAVVMRAEYFRLQPIKIYTARQSRSMPSPRVSSGR
jgi:hypothetical protein